MQSCIAAPVLNMHRRKREHNAHLFAVESPLQDEEQEFESSQTITEEQWTTDAKKAKMELEDYEDVD